MLPKELRREEGLLVIVVNDAVGDAIDDAIGRRRVDHTVRIMRQLLVVIGRVGEDGRERRHPHVEITGATDAIDRRRAHGPVRRR